MTQGLKDFGAWAIKWPFSTAMVYVLAIACAATHSPLGQHTPGPWLVDSSIGGPGDTFTIYRDYRPTPQSGPRVVVALIPGSKLHMADPEARDANARLIASAPDLDLYRIYVERKIALAEKAEWMPVCYTKYLASEMIEEDRKGATP